jgi:hypothetical protein
MKYNQNASKRGTISPNNKRNKRPIVELLCDFDVRINKYPKVKIEIGKMRKSEIFKDNPII